MHSFCMLEFVVSGMFPKTKKAVKLFLLNCLIFSVDQRSLEIARKMLANGMDAATVMEITGLSEIQLQQLKG